MMRSNLWGTTRQHSSVQEQPWELRIYSLALGLDLLLPCPVGHDKGTFSKLAWASRVVLNIDYLLVVIGHLCGDLGWFWVEVGLTVFPDLPEKSTERDLIEGPHHALGFPRQSVLDMGH